MKKSVLIRGIAVLVLVVVSLASIVFAIPTNPTGPNSISRIADSRMNDSTYNPITIQAEAGNVTQLTMIAKTQTQTWQGYYGQITGIITLDDANNFTFYDWYAAEPQGEIYAATATVSDWTTVHCLNYSNDGVARNITYDGGQLTTETQVVINLTELEENLGLLAGDYDGVDETFNESGTIISGRTASGYTYQDHDEFFVGTINISSGSCPATNTYETHCLNITESDPQDHLIVADTFCDGSQNGNYTWDATEDGTNFQEVLLTVNNSETVIYTTIIENRRGDNDTDPYGFNNNTWDFQLLVGEDGHPGPGQDTTTPYYFYVELE